MHTPSAAFSSLPHAVMKRVFAFTVQDLRLPCDRHRIAGSQAVRAAVFLPTSLRLAAVTLLSGGGLAGVGRGSHHRRGEHPQDEGKPKTTRACDTLGVFMFRSSFRHPGVGLGRRATAV